MAVLEQYLRIGIWVFEGRRSGVSMQKLQGEGRAIDGTMGSVSTPLQALHGSFGDRGAGMDVGRFMMGW